MAKKSGISHQKTESKETESYNIATKPDTCANIEIVSTKCITYSSHRAMWYNMWRIFIHYVEVSLLSTQLKILRHREVDEVLRALPEQLVDSFEEFEQAIRFNEDLSPFTSTKPFSKEDGLGNRTGIEHYHLMPCRPDCYLIWLGRTVDAAYILEISLHPTTKEFTSSEVEGRLYSRYAELCPDLTAYKIPSSYRYSFPVSNKYKFGARAVKNAPAIAPVRTSTADYLPLGQTTNLPEGRNRIGIIVGTFGILTEEIPEAAFECIDYENHPERESLTLFAGGWAFHSGVYRPETEQLLLWFCELHHVVMTTGSRRESAVLALNHEDYAQLENDLKARFP